MNSSDWKRLADEKPAHGQKVLWLRNDGELVKAIYRCGDVWVSNWWQPWADPPKPDPFEEYWLEHKDGLPLPKSDHHHTWLACLRWAREHPEELKAR